MPSIKKVLGIGLGVLVIAMHMQTSKVWPGCNNANLSDSLIANCAVSWGFDGGFPPDLNT
jgi:hypothetical protein